eukprot:1115515-Prymnesium_polylepis.1
MGVARERRALRVESIARMLTHRSLHQIGFSSGSNEPSAALVALQNGSVPASCAEQLFSPPPGTKLSWAPGGYAVTQGHANGGCGGGVIGTGGVIGGGGGGDGDGGGGGSGGGGNGDGGGELMCQRCRYSPGAVHVYRSRPYGLVCYIGTALLHAQDPQHQGAALLHAQDRRDEEHR